MSWLRVAQIVALGLWVGAGVFFSFVSAPRIFAFLVEELPQSASAGLPSVDERAGRRLAGAVVQRIFGPYFVLQLCCAAVAGLTTWFTDGFRRGSAPLILIALAVVMVLVQLSYVFPRSEAILAKVHELELSQELDEADRVRGDFMRLHGVSQVLNLATLACAAVALVLMVRSLALLQATDASAVPGNRAVE